MAVEVFCGAGGMTLGFEQAGFDVGISVDSDLIHARTHAQNFPRTLTISKDVNDLNAEDILKLPEIKNKKISVLFGGPPCQGFSMIGKRDMDDPRNLLLYEFARLVSELKPLYFVVENVSGLAQGDARNVLYSFFATVRQAGYEIVDPPQILDASVYGVPQYRRRIFILGFRRGRRIPNYPDKGLAHTALKDFPNVFDAISDLTEIEGAEELFHSDIYYGSLNGGSEYAKILRGEIDDPMDKSHHRIKSLGLTGCGRVTHSKEVTTRFENTAQGECEKISRFHRLDANNPANTLRAGSDKSRGSFTAPRPIHPLFPRCITVREAARIQSFPDWFVFDSTKWHGFRQVGNAVPPLLARAVALEIMKCL